MSFSSLISHRLFVAAVKDKTGDQSAAGPRGPSADVAESHAKEIQMELMDETCPRPNQREFSAKSIFCTGST
jgi:hypothetical protein